MLPCCLTWSVAANFAPGANLLFPIALLLLLLLYYYFELAWRCIDALLYDIVQIVTSTVLEDAVLRAPSNVMQSVCQATRSSHTPVSVRSS